MGDTQTYQEEYTAFMAGVAEGGASVFTDRRRQPATGRNSPGCVSRRVPTAAFFTGIVFWPLPANRYELL